MYTDIDFTKVNTDGPAPVNEPDRQYYYIRKCQEYIQKKEEELGRKLTFCTQTFGDARCCFWNPDLVFLDSDGWRNICDKGISHDAIENDCGRCGKDI